MLCSTLRCIHNCSMKSSPAGWLAHAECNLLLGIGTFCCFERSGRVYALLAIWTFSSLFNAISGSVSKLLPDMKGYGLVASVGGSETCPAFVEVAWILLDLTLDRESFENEDIFARAGVSLTSGNEVTIVSKMERISGNLGLPSGSLLQHRVMKSYLQKGEKCIVT